MRTERAEFQGGQGLDLGGRLDLPDDGNVRGYAVFAHCFGCTKNLKTIGFVDKALTDAGLGVLRFDFTGLGDSEGDFADTNFTSNVSDVIAAADFLSANLHGPSLLIGHSLGGAAIMQAAGSVAAAKAVVTIAAPSDLTHLGKTIVRQAPDIEHTGEAEVTLIGRRFHIKKQLLDDLNENNMETIVGQLRLPLLILHAPGDDIVPFSSAERLFSMAGLPKSLVALDRADHLLLNEVEAHYAGRIIAAWFSRYL